MASLIVFSVSLLALCVSCFRVFCVFAFSAFSRFLRFRVFCVFAFSAFLRFLRFRVSCVFEFSRFRVCMFSHFCIFQNDGMDCFGTYFTHAQSCDNVRVQSATEWTASVHTLHMLIML